MFAYARKYFKTVYSCTDSMKWLFLYYGMKTSSRLHGLMYTQTHMQKQTVNWYLMIVISKKISTPALFISKIASHNYSNHTFCKMHRNILISKSNNIMLKTTLLFQIFIINAKYCSFNIIFNEIFFQWIPKCHGFKREVQFHFFLT